MRLSGLRRTTIRLPLIVFWTVLLFALRLSVFPVRFFSRTVEQALRAALFKAWGRVTIRLLGGRLWVLGDVPKPPFLLVTNHLSYVDIIVSAAVTGTTFVAKREIASWPFIGFCAKCLETLFIGRNDLRDVIDVKNKVGEMLSAGYGVHIFAEGGISQDLRLKPFKPALLDAAVRHALPVHYAAITYRTPEDSPPPSKVVAWLEGKSFVEHFFDLLASRGFDVEIRFGNPPLYGKCRKELASRLTAEVGALYQPIP